METLCGGCASEEQTFEVENVSGAFVPVASVSVLAAPLAGASVDFNHLKTFLEISRKRSFSRAAEKLHISQPSISAQIQILEKYLGHRLFERGGGKVVLTAAGRVFEPFAEECLQRLSHIQMTISDLERSPRGSLTVSANESTALYVLPTFFGRFKRQYPRVSLNIVRAERAETIANVLRREVEFGVVSLPVKDPKLHVEVIHKDRLVLAVPPSHPLAKHPRIEITDLARQNLLLPSRGRRREVFDRVFEEKGVVPRVAMELDSSELLKRLILAEVGIGFLPRINLLAELKAKQICEIEINGMDFSRDLGLISHKDHAFTRAGAVFYQVATGRAAPMPV